LPNKEARDNFLITLANEQIADILSRPGIRKAFNIFQNPAYMKKLPDQEISQIIESLIDINKIIEYIIKVSNVEKQLLKEEEKKANGLAIRSQIYESNPLFRIIVAKIESLSLRIEKKPLEFVLFMDNLSPTQRLEFMRIIDEFIGYKDGEESPVRKKLQKTIDNRNLLAVGKRQGYKPQVMEVYLVDGKDLPKDALVGPSDQAGQKGHAIKHNKPIDKSRAPYRIKVETMIDLTLRYSASNQWTPALAREVRRLNRDGRYSVEFVDNYPMFLNNYPDSQRTYEDPCLRLRNLIGAGFRFDESTGTNTEEEKVPLDIYLILQDIMRSHYRGLCI